MKYDFSVVSKCVSALFKCSCEIQIFCRTLTKKVITPFCHYYTKNDNITKVEHVRIHYYHCINKIKPIEMMYCVAIGSQVTLDFTRSCCHKNCVKRYINYNYSIIPNQYYEKIKIKRIILVL